MDGKIVDYMDMMARVSEEERAGKDEKVVLPEPAGEQVVDYLAVSEKWKEERARMANERE